MVIRRVSPLSVAKIAGLLYVILGLLFGGVLSLMALAGWAAGGGELPGMGMLFGAGAIVVLPLVYGCMGFVVTGIMALLYNVVSGIIGGVEVEVG
jgi:hypothetical protein